MEVEVENKGEYKHIKNGNWVVEWVHWPVKKEPCVFFHQLGVARVVVMRSCYPPHLGSNPTVCHVFS